MSFGGGSTQYRIDYIIKVANEGGVGGINQVKQGIEGVNTVQKQASVSADRMAAANHRVQASNLAVNKAAKGMVFGIIGMTTAGAEFVGMLSMWQATQDGVREANEAANEALKEGGKESTEYKNAMQDVAKANRWAQMTFRNLMLSTFDLVPFTVMSINGFMNLKKAMNMRNEAKAARDALASIGVSTKSTAASMGAMNTAAATSGITLSKFGKGAVIARGATFKLGTDVLKSTAAMKGIDAAMLSSSIAASKATTTITATSKAMRVLSIAAKVLIPLIALEIGAQAFQNNWGGFADKINAVGAAIGKAIPQLKGFLELIGKIGKSIVAIFTGNFEDIGEIWNGVASNTFKASEASEEYTKNLEDAAQAVADFRAEADTLFRDIALADKGDRKDFFEKLGITTGKTKFDDAKKGAKDFFNELEDGINNLDSIELQLQTLDKLFTLESLGMEVDPDISKKIRFSMEDKLRDVFEGSDDIFDNLADVVKKNATASQPEFNAAMAEFAADHPGLVQALEKMGYPDMANYFDGLAVAMKDQMRKSLGANLLTNESDEAETWKDQWWDDQFKEEDSTTMFSGIVDELKKGVAGLPGQIKAMDWKAIGTAFRDQISTILGDVDAAAIGKAIHTYIIKPAYNFAYPFGFVIGQAMKDGLAQFRKNPIGSTLGTANAVGTPIAEFVTGALGYSSEQAMYDDWTKQIVAIFEGSEALMQLRAFVNNPTWNGLMALLKGTAGGPSRFTFAMSPKEAIEGKKNIGQVILDYLDKNVVQPIIATYKQFKEDPIVKEFVQLVTDPLGFILTFPGDFKAQADKTAKAGQASGIVMFEPWPAIQTNIIQPMQDAWDTFVNSDIVKNFWNMVTNPMQAAEAATSTQFVDMGEENMTLSDKLRKFGKNDIPPLPDKLPPIPTNQTPTVVPTNYTVDLSKATYTPTMFQGGGDSVAPGSPQANTRAVYIDYPGTVMVKPAAVQIDIDWATIMSSASVGMQAIETGWLTLLMNMSSLANTTVQAIALVFGGMTINISAGITGLAATWSAIMNSFGENAQSGTEQINSAFEECFVGIGEGMQILASGWSEAMNSFGSNAESGAEQILDALTSAMDEIISAADDMLGEWSSVMDDMVSAAEDAAEDIANELASIPDEEVKINYVRTGATGKAHGTSGEWVHKPKLFMAGEQGPEFVQVTRAHSKPSVGGDGGDSGDINNISIPVTLKISGSEIVNSTKLSRKIRMTIGEDRDKFG